MIPIRSAIAFMTLALAAMMLGLTAGTALAQVSSGQDPGRQIELAAASNFSQGLSPRFLKSTDHLPVLRFRDGMEWNRVERAPGNYVFDQPRIAYPEALAAQGSTLTVTVNWGNSLYDEGATPHSHQAIDAHARYVAALLDRFLAIEAIEVGNEFNGNNFVRGPIRTAPESERALYHVAILEAVHEAVKADHLDVMVLGGATHSIPAAYLWDIFDRGGADMMDALAIHPYTTPPEQLANQLAVVRRHEAARTMPVHVTEFGHEDPETADDHLVKMVAAMAGAGVTRAVWYPLNPRGDGMVPLIRRDGELTTAGRAYRFAQEKLAGRPAEDVSPDPFTYAFKFGDDTLVLWGEPRLVALARDDIAVYDAEGDRLAPSRLRLSMEYPLVIIGQAPLFLGKDVHLGESEIIADSFHQFAYPKEGEGFAPGDGFQRFVRVGGRERPLRTMPGQERGGVLWTPYLGRANLYPLRLTASQLVPGGGGRNPVEVVHRYVAPAPQTVDALVRWNPAERSEDGIAITVTHNGSVLASALTSGEYAKDIPKLELQEGGVLEFSVAPNGTLKGDVTTYHIQLKRAG